MSSSSPSLIDQLRAEIDALDAKILDLLNRRAQVALRVGAEKHKTGAPIFRPEREAQVIANLIWSVPPRSPFWVPRALLANRP